MTAHTEPSDYPYRERFWLSILGVLCCGLVAGAVFIQYHSNEDPCPLCIIQRYLFLLVALFAFLGARTRNWGRIRIYELLTLVTASGGIATALRHLIVQASPAFSCGFDALEPVVDALPPAHWLPGVFKVAGLCEMPYPPIFHLSLPAWSLLGFAAIFGALVISLVRNGKRG